jgi:hypothetical protein
MEKAISMLATEYKHGKILNLYDTYAGKSSLFSSNFNGSLYSYRTVFNFLLVSDKTTHIWSFIISILHLVNHVSHK